MSKTNMGSNNSGSGGQINSKVATSMTLLSILILYNIHRFHEDGDVDPLLHHLFILAADVHGSGRY